MDLSKACSCLNNTAQIDGTINRGVQIGSEITQSKQINSDMFGLTTVHIVYNGAESDNIIVNINNDNRTVSATLKQVQFQSSEDFPEVGSDKLVYVSLDDNSLWFFDSAEGTYKKVSGDGEVSKEFIESALKNYTTTEELEKLYATKQFVEENGGKIDSISVNGEQQEIVDKNVNIGLAGAEKAGVVKVSGSQYGLHLTTGGVISLAPADKNQISLKQSRFSPITPYQLDHAIKVGLTTNTETLTDEEKITVQKWIGATNTEYVNEQITDVIKVAEGKTKSFTIDSLNTLGNLFDIDTSVVANEYSIPTTTINYKEQSIELKQGDLFLIVDTNVPDYWVSVDDMKLYKMETAKVDLTDYVKNTDYATSSKGGVVRTSASFGIECSYVSRGLLSTIKATDEEISAKTNLYKPIVPASLDYAVKVGLTTNVLELTDEEKTNARELLGSASTDIASTPMVDNIYVGKAGLLLYDGGGVGGLFKSTAGGNVKSAMRIKKANFTEINNRKPNNYHDAGVSGANNCCPITPANFDYAFKRAFLDDKLNGYVYDNIDYSWTDAEKTQAQSFLGINTLLDNKVDKITTQGTLRVYGIGGDGNQTTYTVITSSNNVAVDRIPRYQDNAIASLMAKDNAVLASGTPIQDHHVANKKYVDDKFNGANKAVSFVNYSTMITSLNSLDNTKYGVGQNIMIVTLLVPDLWVSEIADESVTYTYVSDGDFVNELSTNGSVQVGYYKLSALETQKVDLADYAKTEDLDNKLDKKGSGSYNRVYVVTWDGNQTTYNVDVGVINNAVPLRTTTGQIRVPETPTEDNNATSKKYVDYENRTIKDDLYDLALSTSTNDSILSNQISALQTDKADKSELPIGLPIGSIISSAIPITDASVQLLDGHTISQSGAYADFVALLKEKVSSGSVKTCTSQEFDNEVALYGNCGKFVIDDSAGTIRLPRITRFIQGLSSLSDIGTSVEAGLPNITGTFDPQIANNGGRAFSSNAIGTGAFYQISYGTTGRQAGQTSSNFAQYGFGFDASQANSIYGNSNTVQPQATQFPYYIVLSNTVKTNIVVDIDNIASDLSATNNEIASVKATVNSRDYIVEQGDDYIRWNGGKQICWGKFSAAGDTNATFNFPKPFIDTNYSIQKNFINTTDSGMPRYSTDAINDLTTTSFTCSVYKDTVWYAIGKWK